MKYSSVVLSIASLTCGLIAAWYWYRASKILFEPKFSELSEEATEMDVNWELVRAIMIAVQKGSALNRLAALWTAAAGLLGGATGLIGTLAAY